MFHYIKYDLKMIQDEARYLVRKGCISRQQPIYVISKYLSDREWIFVERELEERNLKLGDRISILLGNEQWDND